MRTLNVKITMDDEDLTRSVNFIHGNPEHTPEIIEQYFGGDNIEIDMTCIEDKDARFYHTNGLTALLITLQNK